MALSFTKHVKITWERYTITKKFGFIEPTLEALKDKRGVKVCEKKLGLTADLEPCGFLTRKYGSEV